jgi:hypothetical protein
MSTARSIFLIQNWETVIDSFHVFCSVKKAAEGSVFVLANGTVVDIVIRMFYAKQTNTWSLRVSEGHNERTCVCDCVFQVQNKHV